MSSSAARRVVDAVIARDGGWCLMALPGCMGEANVAHHRANRGSGGSKVLDCYSNLVAVCSLCNGAAEDAHAIVRLDLIGRGLRVQKDTTNAKTLARCRVTPVEDLQGRWWFLLPDGSRVECEEPPF